MILTVNAINFFKQPLFFIFSDKKAENPTEEDIQGYYKTKVTENKEPNFFLRRNPLELIGAGVGIIGIISGLFGLSKDSSGTKWFGGLLTLLGIVGTVVGKFMGVGLKGEVTKGETEKFLPNLEISKEDVELINSFGSEQREIFDELEKALNKEAEKYNIDLERHISETNKSFSKEELAFISNCLSSSDVNLRRGAVSWLTDLVGKSKQLLDENILAQLKKCQQDKDICVRFFAIYGAIPSEDLTLLDNALLLLKKIANTEGVQENIKSGITNKMVLNIEKRIREVKGERTKQEPEPVGPPNQVTEKEIAEQKLINVAANGQVDVVRELLQREDIDVNAQTKDGWTALMCASHRGHVEIVEELLQQEVIDVNVQNSGGWTALMLASNNGHIETVRELLQREEIDINAHNRDGWTALMLAAYAEDTDVIEELLRHPNVDIDIRNSSDKTALDIAREEQEAYKQVVTLFESYIKEKEKADDTKKDDPGKKTDEENKPPDLSQN